MHVQETFQVMQDQIYEFEKVGSLFQKTTCRFFTICSNPKRPGDGLDNNSHELDRDDERTDGDVPIPNQGKALAIDDIHMVYRIYQAVSHGDLKLYLPESNGESNRDTFIDWIVQVEESLNTRSSRIPRENS